MRIVYACTGYQFFLTIYWRLNHVCLLFLKKKKSLYLFIDLYRIIRNHLKKVIHPYSIRPKSPHYSIVCRKFYIVTHCFAFHWLNAFEIGTMKKKWATHSSHHLANPSFWKFIVVSLIISRLPWSWQKWKQNGNQHWPIFSK